MVEQNDGSIKAVLGASQRAFELAESGDDLYFAFRLQQQQPTRELSVKSSTKRPPDQWYGQSTCHANQPKWLAQLREGLSGVYMVHTLGVYSTCPEKERGM